MSVPKGSLRCTLVFPILNEYSSRPFLPSATRAPGWFSWAGTAGNWSCSWRRTGARQTRCRYEGGSAGEKNPVQTMLAWMLLCRKSGIPPGFLFSRPGHPGMISTNIMSKPQTNNASRRKGEIGEMEIKPFPPFPQISPFPWDCCPGYLRRNHREEGTGGTRNTAACA